MTGTMDHAAPLAQTAETPPGHRRLMRAATYASVTVALILVAGKLAVWFITDSVAILSSLIDSALDAGASLINMFAVAHALTPADREHRFGHGKAESLSALAQSAFITGSALFLMFEASHRIFSPQAVSHGRLGMAMMVASIALTGALVLFQRFVVRRTQSVAVAADSLHYMGDLMANLAVIAALVLASEFDMPVMDPIFAVLVAVYILYGAYQIARTSMDQLMDRELPDDQRQQILELAMEHPAVENVHDLRTRSSGLQSFIQMHLELDGQMPLYRAHAIAGEVELRIMQAFPEAEVIIHQDPAGHEDELPHTQL